MPQSGFCCGAVIASVLCACLPANRANASNWIFHPRLSLLLDHSSNRELTLAPASDTRVRAAVDLTTQFATENFSLQLQPNVSTQRLQGHDQPSYNDTALATAASWLQEKDRFNLHAIVADENTIGNGATDIGSQRLDLRRRQASAAAGWNHTMSETNEISLQLSFADAAYRGPDASDLPGYTYLSASASERWAVTERLKLSARLFANNLRTRFDLQKTRESGIGFGAELALSPRTRLAADLGFSERRHGSETERGIVGNLSLQQDLVRGDWTLGLSRSLVPYGIGNLVERSEISLQWTQPFNERLFTTFDIRAIQNQETLNSNRLTQRDYQSARGALNWRLNEELTLGWQLGYDRVRLTRQLGIAQGRNMAFTVTWMPRPRALGR